MKAAATVTQSFPKQTEKQLLGTLEITARFAFGQLRKGKYRRAEKTAAEACRLIPRGLRRTTVALELRMIALSGRHIANWLYNDERERKGKRKRRQRHAGGKVVPFAPATSHLLLVPEYPMADGPEVADKQ